LWIQHVHTTISFFYVGVVLLAKVYFDFHVRLSEEEHDFLRKSGINKSKLVHDAIKEEMDKLPENLRERKERCLREIEEIKARLEKLSEKKVIAESYVDEVIVYEFLKYGIINNSDDKNISWLKDRHSSELDKRDILMSPVKLLQYCKNAYEEKKNASR